MTPLVMKKYITSLSQTQREIHTREQTISKRKTVDHNCLKQESIDQDLAKDNKIR